MKKRVLLLIVALAVIAAGIGGTISFFSSGDTADNVFTVGDVKISLTEPNWDESKDHIIAPKATFDKDPRVTNEGDNDAYVRVHVKFSNYAKLKEAITGTATGEVEPVTLLQGNDAEVWELKEETAADDNSTITYTYVYRKILKVGETSEPVFSQVLFPQTTDQGKIMALPDPGFEIEVTADAIQSEGFGDADEAFQAFDAGRN